MENRPAVLADSAQRRARLLTNSGALLVSAAASFIIVAPAAVAPGHALVAFLLLLLGVSMVMLALVAERFPGAAWPLRSPPTATCSPRPPHAATEN